MNPVSQSNISLSKPLHPYLTENPKETLRVMASKSYRYDLASKVCTAAFLAIAAVAITVSLGIAVPIPPAVLIGSIIGTIPLQIASSHFQDRSIDYKLLAQTAQGHFNALQRIQNWGSKEIKEFLIKNNIAEETLPKEDLAKVEPKEPLKALLPLIARHQYWCDQAETFFLRYQANLHNTSVDESLRTLGRSEGWSILETKVIPSALKAAFMLHILTDPKTQISWENLGTCQGKSFEQRMFDRMLDKSDDYFRFKNPLRSPLTLEELSATLNPLDVHALQAKLFPDNAYSIT